jgi:hypothetical protein
MRGRPILARNQIGIINAVRRCNVPRVLLLREPPHVRETRGACARVRVAGSEKSDG